MECIYCNAELEDHEYKFCRKCLKELRRKYAKEYSSMTGLDFEDYLDERNQMEKERDQLSEDELQD